MRTTAKYVLATALVASAMPAFAAPTITSAAVTGPSGTVWDTAVNSYYTLFISRPLGTVFNPNDNFSGAPLTGPVEDGYAFGINGDGFPTNTMRPPKGKPQIAPPSDPIYTLTLNLSENGTSRTLSGTYVPSTAIFTPLGNPAVLASGTYSLEDFAWMRTLSNTVGSFSSTNTSYNAATNPGSGFDYLGSFSISDAVPEPTTWGLMIVGFGAVGAMLRVRRRPRVVFA